MKDSARGVTFWPPIVPPVWLVVGSALLFLPTYHVLSQLEPYASRTADEVSVDVFLVRLVSMLIPYTIWVFFRGLARTQLEIRALRPALGVTDREFEDLSRSLVSFTSRELTTILVLSTLFVALLQQYNSQRLTVMFASPSAADLWLLSCGMASWTAVLTAGFAAVRNANAFRKLADCVDRLDPFDIEPIRPFSRFGLRMALYFVGGIGVFQAAHLFAPVRIHRMGFLLAILSVLPAVAIFLLSSWGVHQRQLQRKRELLREVRSELAGQTGHVGRMEGTLRPLLDLLEYRDRIRSASEWPFEVSAVIRLALYTVIPLASWIAAALIERLLDRLLG